MKLTLAKFKANYYYKTDLTMTVGDFIREYQQNDDLVDETAEEKTYQWNNFVKDFCADPASQQFPNKMKVAAILWGRVKRSMGPKEYRHQLLCEYVSDNRS